MKKYFAMLLLVVMLGSVWSASAEDAGKALIIYFDYSENIDTTGMDVDAISHASILGTRERDISNLLVQKDEIAARTGADVYSLRVVDLYAPNFMDMMGPAQEQKDNNVVMTFQEAFPDFADYDVIYLGSPVWWYGAPQSILSFLQQVDLSGKQIVFFGIHRGSYLAGIPEQIQELQPNATVVDSFTVECRVDNEETRRQINAFLDGLGV